MRRSRTTIATLVLIAGCIAGRARGQQVQFIDASERAGLGKLTASRMCLADLNGDGRPDAIIRAIEAGQADCYRVYLNQSEAGAAKFVELTTPTGLPTPKVGDCLVFSDLDNDGNRDAIFTRYLDINNEKFTLPVAPDRTCWLPGKGDGTFEAPIIIEQAQRATTACVAVGDVDGDGLLDLYLGNWYTKYGESNDAFENDLLVQSRQDEMREQDLGTIARRSFMKLAAHRPTWWQAAADPDAGGRPTYGVMMAHLGRGEMIGISLLELNYGRRANRIWVASGPTCIRWANRDRARSPAASQAWTDGIVEETPPGFDGDANRTGTYPAWLKERAKTDPRFARDDELPFRSHGNTFDCAVGDIDNDGDFDLFLSEITHAWAGPSSDRSRFLVNQVGVLDGDIPNAIELASTMTVPPLNFVTDARLCVDRVPADPTIRTWNQGDLFAELADFDHDGRLDLLLSSGDYPDNQRLRLFRQQQDGAFADITPWTGLNNEGSQQISLGDVDGDGDLDILVGQSFNRLDAAQIAGRTPTVKLYLNQVVERRAERIKNGLETPGVARNSLTMRLKGCQLDGINRDALGVVVAVTADLDGDPSTPAVRQVRQLIGIGGHAGKQHEFLLHVGLGAATKADTVEILWQGGSVQDGVQPEVRSNLEAGLHEIRYACPK